MKLRNKKTGEIQELKVAVNGDLAITKDDKIVGIYSSLTELNEEWEDYEEPKEYWYINPEGKVYVADDSLEGTKASKEIGNYFSSREEAVKAVEKLEAWKRLKDVGFKFNNFVRDAIYYEISDEEIEKDIVRNDLNLLFGGEE